MMSIHRCPSFLQGLFRPFCRHLSKPQFTHLWAYVLGLAVCLKEAKLIHLSAAAPAGGHRTRGGAFLSDSHWDAPALLQQSASGLLAGMKPKAGEVVYLILDDIRIAKRGKQMDWVSKIYDHKTQRFIHGHMILTCAILFRGVVLPWRIELWKPKGRPGPRYRKLTAMAAGMIRAFAAPAGVKVRVLFDAFYLCPAVTRACTERGFTFFSVAQKNRCFTTANGKRRNLGTLAPGLLRHQGRAVRMKRARKTAKLRIASVDGKLSRIGAVRVVLSKRPRTRWKTLVAIVTNETNLKPRQIVAIYERRWAIEVLFKQLACDLGLGDYQMLDHQAISRHLHRVCLAHLTLTHQSLERLGAQATTPDKQVILPTMQQRLQSLRREILCDQIQQLVKGPHHAKLRKKLQQHLLAAA
jgi:SRSO17 transposase